MSRSPRSTSRLAAVAGLLSAGAALAAGELAAALRPGAVTPVVAVADAVIAHAPPSVTHLAIAVLGQRDKPALIVGTVVLLAVLAAGLGLAARRRRGPAVAGVAALGGVAALAAATTGRGAADAVVPAAAAVIAGVAALVVLTRRLPTAEGGPAAPPAAAAPAGKPVSRRGFLSAAGGVAALAVGAGAAGWALRRAVGSVAARAGVVLPTPARVRDLPVVADARVDGLPPVITPNTDFYRIDTALIAPRVDPDTHVLRVVGMVEQELEIPFPRLLERDLVELPMNLVCVSNEVGGDLVDAAVWRGVLLRDLLDEAGVQAGATQVVGRSVDGYTCGFPVGHAYAVPAMVAVGMNGEPLPVVHGFPVRLVTPGIYGYVGATKWLEEIELTTFEAFDQYWVPRGYAPRAPVKASSRIEVPRAAATVPAGTVVVAGSAWAPPVGIGGVEVRVDDGPWRPAELAAPVNDLTWRQWSYRWEDAPPGPHRLTVRATDRDGVVQVAERSGIRPDGATGLHTVTVTVADR